jgi:hypothetical protein
LPVRLGVWAQTALIATQPDNSVMNEFILNNSST